MLHRTVNALLVCYVILCAVLLGYSITTHRWRHALTDVTCIGVAAFYYWLRNRNAAD